MPSWCLKDDKCECDYQAKTKLFRFFTAGKSVTKIRNRMFEEGNSYVTAVWKSGHRFVTEVLQKGQDFVTKLSRSNVSILLIPLIFFESWFRTDVRFAVVTILLRASGL